MRRYTDRDMQKVLRQLKIQDEQGAINAHEVAAIWSWRAKEENDVEHTYSDGSVRKRVADKALKPINPGESRLKFAFEDAFFTPLYPQRTKKKQEQSA